MHIYTTVEYDWSQHIDLFPIKAAALALMQPIRFISMHWFEHIIDSTLENL